METIETLIEEYVAKSKKHFWDGSPFERLLKLGLDERGEWGENLIYTILSSMTDLDIIWEGSKNTYREDGSIWDILIYKWKTEIKTAMRGSTQDTWQHEKIVETHCWDKIIFIDLDYNGIWFTIQDYSQIPFGESKHEILGIKSTECKGGWKFDLSGYRISKLKESGYSFYLDMGNKDFNKLTEFFKFHFQNNS